MGRSLKLTEETLDKLLKGLKAGLSISSASALAGIDDSTFYRWQQRAASGDSRFREFCDTLKRAQADAELSLLNTIRAASERNWQASAWILERRFPEKWGRKSSAEVIVENTIHNEVKKNQVLPNMSSSECRKMLEQLSTLLEDPEINSEMDEA